MVKKPKKFSVNGTFQTIPKIIFILSGYHKNNEYAKDVSNLCLSSS